MQLQQHVTKLHGGDIVWSCFSLRANLIILHPALSQAYASDVLQVANTSCTCIHNCLPTFNVSAPKIAVSSDDAHPMYWSTAQRDDGASKSKATWHSQVLSWDCSVMPCTVINAATYYASTMQSTVVRVCMDIMSLTCPVQTCCTHVVGIRLIKEAPSHAGICMHARRHWPCGCRASKRNSDILDRICYTANSGRSETHVLEITAGKYVALVTESL